MTGINILALFGIEITELEIYEQTDSGESRESATAISSSDMDETVVLSHIKNPFRPLGGVSGEGLSPNNQTRAASQPSLIVWRDDYTIGTIIHHLLVYLAKNHLGVFKLVLRTVIKAILCKTRHSDCIGMSFFFLCFIWIKCRSTDII